MDESQKQEKAEYFAKLASALEEKASSLSEVAAIELRRRLNTTSAIIHSARPAFHQMVSMQKELRQRRKSRTPILVLIGCLVVAGGLHYVFRDPTKYLDFTFGALVAVYGLVSYILYSLDTHWQAQALERHQRRIDELLYRWIANGGSEDRFWQLRSQVNLDLGDIDMDTEAYCSWWYEMKADLLDTIDGEIPGIGSWRPRYYGW